MRTCEDHLGVIAKIRRQEEDNAKLLAELRALEVRIMRRFDHVDRVLVDHMRIHGEIVGELKRMRKVLGLNGGGGE